MDFVILAGQVVVGGWQSFTVIVKVQEGFTCAAPSMESEGAGVAVQVTVVVPLGKNDPEAGMQVMVPHEPVGVGAGYVVTAPHWFGSLHLVMFAGQVIEQT